MKWPLYKTDLILAVDNALKGGNIYINKVYFCGTPSVLFNI